MARVKNTMKAIECSYRKINPYYDMTIENMNDIYNNSSGPFNMICVAFRFGYVQGTKAEKARVKKNA